MKLTSALRSFLSLRLSLRSRLTILLSATVIFTTVLVGIVIVRTVIRPIAQEVFNVHLSQVVFCAREIERGIDPSRLQKQLSFQLELRAGPPRRMQGPRGRRACMTHRIRGRRVVACPPPIALVAVQLRSGGWLLARRFFDPQRPQEKVLWVLIVVGVLVIILCAGLASRVTKPIRTSVSAMDRMAKGDLRHRLPEETSGEVGEVARAFNRMADRVRALLESERSLMASISHELRTPLARLRLHLELLRDHSVPEKRLSAMESDVSDIDRLIEEVLEASRLSIGVRRPTGPVDLQTVIEDALGQVDLPNHEIRLVHPTSEDTLRPEGDHQRLVRLVKNLLENAGKYAPEETTIEVKWTQRSVSVQDEGPGIPESDLRRVFEPFFRGSEGIRNGTAGYGLGLMIAKQIADLHEAELRVENRNDRSGLVVALVLPTPDP